MLILSRCEREVIRIGHNVTVTILKVEGNQVKLGVSAPKAIAVHRDEVYRKIHSATGKQAETEKQPETA